MSETRPCPKCDMKMIQWPSGIALMSDPPQTPWNWRCKCGHTEKGGVLLHQEKSEQERFTEEWERQQ